jgi:cytochrome P450 RapN
VGNVDDEVVRYPFDNRDDLTIDPRYLALHERGPFKAQLLYGEPVWVATRYEDVKTIYTDKRFVRELGVGRDVPKMWPVDIGQDTSIIAYMDPPRHTRIRRLALPAFSAARTRSMQPWVQGLVDETFDELRGSDGPADWVSAFAWPLPLKVATGILGVSREDAVTFRGWIDEVVGLHTEPARRGEVHGLLVDYVRARIAERREHPTDDLLSVLVHAREDDDQFTEEELVSLSLTLFLAGFETTAAQLGSTMFVLLSRPELWQELCEDPDLLPNALEELWRWIPQFRHGMINVDWASEDVELSDGVVIPAGAPVTPEHQLANRDEAAFPRAQEIDFHRSDPEPHLALAWGAHRCLGAHLANLEIELTLRTLLERVPDLRLATAADEVPWTANGFLRSPRELLVRW